MGHNIVKYLKISTFLANRASMLRIAARDVTMLTDSALTIQKSPLFLR
jgi:hypothetical protein